MPSASARRRVNSATEFHGNAVSVRHIARSSYDRALRCGAVSCRVCCAVLCMSCIASHCRLRHSYQTWISQQCIVLSSNCPLQTSCFGDIFLALTRFIHMWKILQTADSTDCMHFVSSTSICHCSIWRSAKSPVLPSSSVISDPFVFVLPAAPPSLFYTVHARTLWFHALYS